MTIPIWAVETRTNDRLLLFWRIPQGLLRYWAVG